MAARLPCGAPGTRGGHFVVIDPATGEGFDAAPDRQPDELDAVVARARTAWRGWRDDPVARRTALLLRFSRRGALLLSWRQDEAGLGDEAVQETRTVL
ncbi:aldehyde dehydrogenase family protein, partial [Streptomyces hirsutus]|uniref:aldehyde dehydrogenase family protein n=1 Tax=Streptomyces hirsutus TaxID=35620 RepID=UPI0036BEEC60